MDEQARPRITLGGLLAGIGVVAANGAVIAEVVKLAGRGGLPLAGLILLTNAVLCVAVGAVVRFRLIPLLVMSTSAALTEALLLQPASAGHSVLAILIVAIVGAAALVFLAANSRRPRRPTSRDR